jgi:hypothetical protein
MVNAFRALCCFARHARIPDSVPIHVEENGWPTSPPVRSYERQAELADSLVRSVHDYRGTFGITDYRWFNLRDGDSSNPNSQVQYGLVRSDYVAKPAFAVYRRLVAEIGPRPEPPPPLRLELRCEGVRLVARVAGDGTRVAGVSFRARGRFAGRDNQAPFRRAIPRRFVHRGCSPAVGAGIVLRDGRGLELRSSRAACRSSRCTPSAHSAATAGPAPAVAP